MPVSIGVHQGSVVEPSFFYIVIEEATKDFGVGDLCMMLLADDLVLAAETTQEVIELFDKWLKQWNVED